MNTGKILQHASDVLFKSRDKRMPCTARSITASHCVLVDIAAAAFQISKNYSRQDQSSFDRRNRNGHAGKPTTTAANPNDGSPRSNRRSISANCSIVLEEE